MRCTRILGTVACSGFILLACEDGPKFDGPDQVLRTQPTERTDRDNGGALQDPWAVEGGRDFQVEATGDSAGRARFCDDSQTEELVQKMITAPILPDRGLGSLPLWGADFTPLLADDLLGKPKDGGFCDPSGSYSNAFTFGPLNEIIVFFDEQTRLVKSMYASKGYLGAMEGTVTGADGQPANVWIRPGDPIRVNSKELKDDNPGSEAHWLHPTNVNLVYRMLRKAYFPNTAEPVPGYDCLSARICRILEVGAYRALRVEDSGVVLFFPPQGGAVDTIILSPVRVAPFEASGALSTGVEPLAAPQDLLPVDGDDTDGPGGTLAAGVTGTLAPAFQSDTLSACSLALDGSVKWKHFSENCVSSHDTLSRASYAVSSARDTVQVEFNGIFLTFQREKGAAPLLDGERPGVADELVSIAFTDNLNGPFAQWVPRSLGGQFKARLEQRVQAALNVADAGHPLSGFDLGELPALSDTATQLSPVVTEDGVDLVDAYVKQVRQVYNGLSATEKAAVDPALAEDTYLIGSFVEAAMAVISGGATDQPGAVVRTIPSDNGLRITGRASFLQEGVAYRLVASYNLVFGGLVYVVLERGFSPLDEPINLATGAGAMVGMNSPYYSHALSLGELQLSQINPFALGATSIQVTGVDRQLEMLSVTVDMVDPATGAPHSFELQVPGEHILEGSGFMRQNEGETWEFVASHTLDFFGRETSLRLSVDAEGVVQRAMQFTFKGPSFLCGLQQPVQLRYGDDVRSKLDAFAASDPQAFRDCGIVFNYSANGNVLDTVVSVINKVGITVSGGRAVSVNAWQ